MCMGCAAAYAAIAASTATFSLSDFNLTDEEMDAISALNQNRRFNDPGKFCEGAFGTFHSIYD